MYRQCRVEGDLLIDRGNGLAGPNVVGQFAADVIVERLLCQAGEEFACQSGKTVFAGELAKFPLDVIGR